MRFPGHFSQIGFCYLVWKHLKTTHGTHFCCSWAFFFCKSAKCDEIWIFLPFWQNMLLVWLKNNNKCYGALRKKCLNVSKLKILLFKNFWPVFWPVLTGFFPFQKNLGQTVRKKNLRPKSNFLLSKVDMKAKNIPTLFKNPSQKVA